MWRERLIRLAIISVSALVVAGGAKVLADQQQKNSVVGKPLKLPELTVQEEQIDEVLGSTVQKILGKKSEPVDQEEPLNQEDYSSQAEETEPMAEPVENIQEQTQDLVESIKKLPEDQLEAVKKQLFKEFCEEICWEEPVEEESD